MHIYPWLKDKKKISGFIKEHYPVFLLIIFPLIFYYPIFLGYSLFPAEAVLKNHSPWKELPIYENNLPWTFHKYHGGDPVFAHYPWKLLGIEMMKKGEWPLWNSYSFAGEPLLANIQSALFYPTNIFFGIMDFPFAWSINSILQTIFGGIFCYFFIRSYKFSKFASLWGSFIFAWNGFLAYFFHIQVIGQTIVWLPLILLALKNLSRKWRGGWYLFLIFSLTSMFLAGFLQFALYNLAAAFLFIIFTCRKSLTHFLSALLISLFIASIQLFPALEYLTKSSRDVNGFYDNDFLLSPWELIKFLMPRFFGYPVLDNWWGFQLGFDRAESLYIGILGIVFAAAGVRYAIKDKINRFWIYMLVIFALISYKSPVSDFIYNLPIPVFNSIAPARGLGMLALPLAFLSALGLETVLIKSKKVIKRDIFLVMGILITAVFLILFFIQNNFQAGGVVIETVKQSILFFIIFSAVFAVIFLSVWKKFLPLMWGLIIIFSLQTLDLVRENKIFTRVFSHSSAIYPSTPLTDYLTNLNSKDRFVSFDLFTLTANTFIPYKLPSYSSYDAIHLKSSEDFARTLFLNKTQSYTYDPRAIRYSFLDKDALNLLNIRYILSSDILNNRDYKLLKKVGSVNIYENKDVYPRAFLISDYGVKQDLEGKVELLEQKNGYYRWNIVTGKPQLLFVSEGFSDGWRGFIDGQPGEVYKANFAFMGVVVPEGSHVVELKYKPDSFIWGKIISFGTINAGLFVLVAYWFYRRRKKSKLI